LKKVLIIAGVVVALLALVGFSVQQSKKNVTTVQTGKVTREDLATVVSASGEIKPKTYVNVGAQGYGKIIKLFVKEGQIVKRGQMLAQLENIQSAADVAAQRANLTASQTDAAAQEAAIQTAVADLKRAQADKEQKELDYRRAEDLYKAQLIAKSDYDARKAAYDVAVAQLAQAEARITQSKAQRDSSVGRISQAKAMLTRYSDQLSKTVYVAPFDGIITNLPVREGESVVVGIQNAPGSTLMTIADMSVITAEVRVDETDIVNVKLDQPVEVTIDALPNQTFKGHVTEIGDQAIIRSSGVATSQATTGSTEAKDFKVVVTLDNPPQNLRPGLSTTAKVTTASKSSTLSIPIQALTIRTPADLVDPKDKKTASSAKSQANKSKEKQEIQGVFVIDKATKKAQFKPVQTGITGNTEIEVTGGINEGEEIVTGSYKVLRTLKNGASVKIDNSTGKKEDQKS
jgi:HlyD family secretion protein